MSDNFIQSAVDWLVIFSTDLLMPVMLFFFVAGLVLRGLIYYTVKRQNTFAYEFEKRVDKYILGERPRHGSFFIMLKKTLERTYYEMFEVRAILKRRKPDAIMSLGDRMFVIQHGTAWLVRDIQKQVRFFKFNQAQTSFLPISRRVFEKNPCFNRIFGVVPIGPFNDFLNFLPGLFIVGGIFGTFLGIMKALPELGAMDISNVEVTKKTMDLFLVKMSYSMSTSIVGIVLNVSMQLYNNFLNPEKTFLEAIHTLENGMESLWKRSINNDLPEDVKEFDEHKDPLDALAEEAVNEQLGITKNSDIDGNPTFVVTGGDPRATPMATLSSNPGLVQQAPQMYMPQPMPIAQQPTAAPQQVYLQQQAPAPQYSGQQPGPVSPAPTNDGMPGLPPVGEFDAQKKKAS